MVINLSKKKILILVNHDVVIYNFRKELVKELLNQNYEVIISSPYGKKIDKLIAMGCKYSEITINRRGFNPVQEYKLLLYYTKLMKEINPDVVLTFTIKPNIYGGLAAQITNRPYIANITGLGTSISNGGIVQKISLFLYKQGLKKANTIFFQNQSNYNTFKKIGIVNNNGILLPGSGVNLEEHNFENYPNQNKSINFLYIGRIMKDKGIDELLSASKTISSKYENVKFNLLGFTEENYLDDLKFHEENGWIKYHGQKSDVHTYIKKSHAVILPSYHEGMANVLLESLSTGRPVIASDIPGCRETFDDRISGFSVEPRDTNSLIKAIEDFIKLPFESKVLMGNAGREKVEREFDRKIVVNNYLKIINNIEENNNELMRQN